MAELLGSANYVLVDRLTLQGASRLVGARGEMPTYYEMEEERRRSDKWNYPLNTGFRIAADVACLAQLVQSIILHEKIYFEQDTLSDSSLGEAREIIEAGTVAPLVLSDADRVIHNSSACERAVECAESSLFKNYLRLLSENSLDAAFIHISHGYFRTGYSDPALFPEGEFAHPIKNSPSSGSLDAYQRLLSQVTRIDGHVLERTAYDKGDVHDKAVAAADVVRNVHASFYYRDVADSNLLTYLPHPLRAAFVAFELMRNGSIGQVTADDRISSILESARARAVEPVNRYFGAEIVHADIPFFLAMILVDECSPEDVLAKAVHIRDTKPARDLRRQIRLIDEMVREGGEQSVTKVRDAIDSFARQAAIVNEVFQGDVLLG